MSSNSADDDDDDANGDDDGAVDACVVRGSLADVANVALVWDTRACTDRDAFLAELGEAHREPGQALLALMDRLSQRDLGALLMGEALLSRVRADATGRDRRAWRNVHAAASVLLGHLASLRGQWKRDYYAPLLDDAAWRDLAATALATFPDTPRPDDGPIAVWPDTPPQPVPVALQRFPAAQRDAEQSLLSADEFAALRRAGRPFVMRGVASHWPAATRWRDPHYLRTTVGHRMLPVEFGRYTSADFEQKVMPFAQFLERCVLARDGRVAYLAHTPLLQLVPALAADVERPAGVPAACEVNAWLGPAATVSPLHTDPRDNVFVQVVGSKLVLLHEASESDCLYARRDGELTNTSQVDAENADATRFPLYARAQASLTVLHAGDALFIPRGCWHHVRALTPSWSVSFWF